jgi:hypothetical protein
MCDKKRKFRKGLGESNYPDPQPEPKSNEPEKEIPNDQSQEED